MALGPHPQRELTLTPRLGFTRPRLGVAAGAFTGAGAPPPARTNADASPSDSHALGSAWPQALLSRARSAFGCPARRLRGCDRQSLLAVRIVHRAALIVEDHRRALVGREWIPLRQALVIRVATARKRDPRAAHLLRKRVAILAVADDRLAEIDVLEHEWDVHAVHRAQPPAADR